MNNFNLQEQEIIINEVSVHPCIWDLTSMEYRNVSKKDKVFSSIGVLLKRTPEEISRCWSALREKYKREKEKAKAQKPRSGAAGGKKYNVAEWPLLQRMIFLDKILRKNVTVESVKQLSASESQPSQLSTAAESEQIENIELDPAFHYDDVTSAENVLSFPNNHEGADEIVQEPETDQFREIAPHPVSSRAANLPGPSHASNLNQGFPISRKRRNEARQMENERMEFVHSISSLAKATQEASTKNAENSMTQNLAIKTAEITAHAILDATKIILSGQNNSENLTADENMVKAFCGYIESRFNQWGPTKKKRGLAIISEALEQIERLEE